VDGCRTCSCQLARRLLIPAISYCRYADDFVVIAKGSKAQTEAMREPCRSFLEGQLKLTINMEKTHVTNVNDGFVFLGHRIIRKRGPRGRMRIASTIPWDKYRRFAEKLVRQLSGDYGANKMDLLESLNPQLGGWANFYQHTDFTATIFSKMDARSSGNLGMGLPANTDGVSGLRCVTMSVHQCRGKQKHG